MITSRIDDGVVDAARLGDEVAWSLVYRELAPAVSGYLRSRRAIEVDDLVADVFLEVARRIQDFEGSAAEFRSWVFVIAHSRMVDGFRRAGRRSDQPVAVVEDHAAPHDTEAHALESFGDEWVLGALDGLSEDQRSIVLLRVFGDLSMAEIADALGKTRTAVKVAHHRAMRVLRDRMQDGEG